jgi:chromosome segregation ATPase
LYADLELFLKQILVQGASALTQMNKDVMLELQMTKAKLEDAHHSAQEMQESLQALTEEQKLRDEADNAPRNGKALAKWGEVRKEKVKQEEKDMMPLQALLDAALQEVEELKEAAVNVEIEREEERQQFEQRAAEFAQAEKVIEKLTLDVRALEKNLASQTDARTKLEERLAQERQERKEQVQSLLEEVKELRPLTKEQEQTIEQLRSQVVCVLQ